MHLRRGLLRTVLAGSLAACLSACGATDSGDGDPAGPGAPEPPVGPPVPPPPAGSIASVGGCQIFPEDNAWNRDVSADPVAANSTVMLAAMSPGSAIHLDLG